LLLQMWREMAELVSSSNNYSCYRGAYSECQGFKIYILRVHLKDLITGHVVFPDWLEESSQVNLVKMHQLYVTFNELVSLQKAVAQLEPNMDLIYLPSFILNCGVNCHKRCREVLVQACRKLSRSSSMGSVSSYPLIHSTLPSSPTLAYCEDEDEVFSFPGVTGLGQGSSSITLMTGSAQKISVRLQRATTSQATQTEPLWPENSWGVADTGYHTFPNMKFRTQRKTSKNKGFACGEKQNGGHHQKVSPQHGIEFWKTDASTEFLQRQNDWLLEEWMKHSLYTAAPHQGFYTLKRLLTNFRLWIDTPV
ncbi:LOW QUALITY PROTEIN: ras guanyl-releasing protein 3, partial [Betta splendens]|uniref:LOW QUALITY PROTEIN: ras guanyl-releasing protein 3 n=1 Tax=Betta splendens TaxID=158456 RepID=A0A6P7KK03_BETSP